MHYSKYVIQLFCLFVLCLSGNGHAHARGQKDVPGYHIETLTIEDGLPFRDVTAIDQDANGLMWFGTTQGLIRYDGYRFKLYNSDRKNPFYIPEEAIGVNGIACGNNHDLWYLGHSTLFLLDTKTDKVTEFGPGDGIEGNVLDLLQDEDGHLWIVTDNFFTRNDQSQQAKQFLLRQVRQDSFAIIYSVPRSSSGITNLAKGPNNTIWWSTITEGQLSFSMEGDLLQSMQPDPEVVPGQSMNPGFPFFTGRNEMFFMSGQGEVWKYNAPAGEFQPLLRGDEIFYTAKEDDHGNTWFGAARSVYLHTTEGTIHDMTPFIREHLAFGETHQFFLDQRDVFWIATDFGLVKLKPKSRLFDPFLNTEEENLTNTMRGFIETADGSVIVMNEYERQLYKILPNNKVSRFDLSNDKGKKEASVLNAARFFVTDKDRKFAYTANQYLVRIDLQNGSCFVDTSFSPYPNVRSLNPIVILDDGRLVAGHTLANLQIYDPVTRKKTSLFAEPLSLPNIENVRFLLESREPNTIWIGTHENGLYKAQVGGDVLAQLATHTDPAIPKDAVLVIHEAQDTSLWVGTFGGGLSHFQPKTNTVRNYGVDDGLADPNVVGILPESDSILWVSTYNGLSRFNTRDVSFQNFTVDEGLTHNEFNYASFFRDSNGRFYFGGMNGFVRFEPGIRFDQNPYPAPIFTSIIKYDQRKNEAISIDLLHAGLDRLTITPNDAYMEVHWTIPSYFDNQDNRYYAKLEGLDDEWTFLENRPFIRYYRIDPGKYALRVKAADSKGNEALNEISIPILVKPAFYRTWWFFAIIVLLISGVIYALFQYRLNQLLKIEKLRTKISSDLHDDLGSMLSGLAMQSELLEMNAPEEERPLLRNITTTSRKAVHRMRDLVWSIDARKDRLSDLIEKMQETAEDLLLPGGFEYHFDVEGVSNERKKLSINARQNLFFMFKEALHNIVKHSNGDNVQIRLLHGPRQVSLHIRDNGVQKKRETNGKAKIRSTGQGLLNMQMRAEHLKGKFEYGHENGFEVRIDVPTDHIFM